MNASGHECARALTRRSLHRLVSQGDPLGRHQVYCCARADLVRIRVAQAPPPPPRLGNRPAEGGPAADN